MVCPWCDQNMDQTLFGKALLAEMVEEDASSLLIFDMMTIRTMP